MTNPDLNKITHEELINIPLKELLAFQEKLQKAVEARKDKEKREIYEKINSLASESGFSLSELFGEKSSKTSKIEKAPAIIKYRNPNNKDEGWTGKGRKPNWLVTLLDTGKKLEDFAV